MFRKKIDVVKIQEQTAVLTEKYLLNEEEQMLAAALLEGKSDKKIASEQKLTISTVKHRVFAFYRKCGVNNRSQLSALARKEAT